MRIFGGKERRTEGSHWLSVSDLMAGLMMIFLFIAITYMRFVQIEKERIRRVAVLANETHTALYESLGNEFENDLHRWKAEIDEQSLTVRFNDPDILFAQNEKDIQPRFEKTLTEFFPRYLKVLDGFEQHLDEVRVEGHTSSEWRTQSSETEAYFNNMDLSQKRTLEVLMFCYEMPGVHDDYPWLKRRFSGVGMSSARLLNDDGKLISDEGGHENQEKSRRVEFTVKTNFEKRIITEILDPEALRNQL
jgi:outer membrane protein OmpA-like peptidoglycan-associated protein